MRRGFNLGHWTDFISYHILDLFNKFQFCKVREFFHLIYGTQYTHLKIFNGSDRSNMSFVFGLKVKVKDLTEDQIYVLDLNRR